MKGYVVELRIGSSYVYLFVEKTTKKCAIETYEEFKGESLKGRTTEVIVRSNKIAKDAEYVQRYAINK